MLSRFDTFKGVNEEPCSIGGTAKGTHAHADMAFSPNGSRVLGVLDIDGEFRSRVKAEAGTNKREIAKAWGLIA